MNDEKLRFPAGYYHYDPDTARILKDTWIEEISSFPLALEQELGRFTDEMLDTPYRPGGWTGRQVVHHLVDSHINSYVRYKLTLTENLPVIKPYLEAEWALMPDYKLVSIQEACLLLKLIHARWTVILKSLDQDQWNRRYLHPEHNREFSLIEALGMYAWHCRHHLGHLKLIVA